MTYQDRLCVVAVIALTSVSAWAGITAESIATEPQVTPWSWLAEIDALPVEGSVENIQMLRIYVGGQLRATIAPGQVTQGNGELDAADLDLNPALSTELSLLWSDRFYLGDADGLAQGEQADILDNVSVAFVRNLESAPITSGDIRLSEGDLFAYDAQSGVGVIYYGLGEVPDQREDIQLIGVLPDGTISVGLRAVESVPVAGGDVAPMVASAGEVPEPATMTVLALGTVAMLKRRRRS